VNILFLTLSDFTSVNERNLYTDLLRTFVKNNHKVYAISPVERKQKQKTHIIQEENAVIVKLRIGNTKKTNVIEKGISTLLIEPQYIGAIKKYFSNVKFDLVLYSTPPITFCNVIDFVKKRDGAKTYLLLKDIFPQNAVDIGMLNKTGFKGVLYKYFRNKEKKLYALSDKIGCMSQANVEYVLKHNPEISASKVEICPNCIEVQDLRLTEQERKEMRNEYAIPLDKTVFVYGGNLGKPQGIPHIIECLKTQLDNPDVFFLIVGDGTEFAKLKAFFDETKPTNMKLMERLPKDDYDRMIAACDVGLIFLDHRFTIPNFPSRLLGYMQAGLPVFACTDPNSDVGKVIVDGNFGWWCESNSTKSFEEFVAKASNIDKNLIIGQQAYAYLKEYYGIEREYAIIQTLLTE